ncbi:MAG: shikimate kinase [Candidatus Liptonbacteria bacterium]|nr:shikimate kinase [Candidatus Liptonbacteria bacterium]
MSPTKPKPRGIALIGMSGSGKSTVGKIIAESLAWPFVDLDEVIREKAGMSHADLLAQIGDEEFKRRAEEWALQMDTRGTVFAPGGSIIYYPSVMEKLRAECVVVYLRLSLPEIIRRAGDNADNHRGIVGFAERGWAGLIAERAPLLEQYAHQALDADDLSAEEAAQNILDLP